MLLGRLLAFIIAPLTAGADEAEMKVLYFDMLLPRRGRRGTSARSQ